MGLPIPQIFLYEDGKNRFLIIDGQQRLMTIYYFMKGRFPKRDARAKIRGIFIEKGRLNDSDLEDESMFSIFRLFFNPDGAPSPYQGLTYASLDDIKSIFDLRTIRNIIVKQLRPDDDKSSIFELFNRLNTGGINLSQQEIRMSLFYGDFIKMVVVMNEDTNWRKVLGGDPDQRQKDVEVILRMFALAADYESFKKPLSKFINEYCRKMRSYNDSSFLYKNLFAGFARTMAGVERSLYLEPKSKRVSVPILEASFAASIGPALKAGTSEGAVAITESCLNKLRNHESFDEYFTGKTTDVEAVKGRINLAKSLIGK